MNHVDMNPGDFRRHARAVESRSNSAEARKNAAPEANQQPESLTNDFAHVTDSTSFLLSSWDFSPGLRGFVDTLIGVAGYRAGRREWFQAPDKEIARRAGRCTKWVQDQRKDLIAWQTQHNVALVDIEDNIYEDGEKIPHKYRVHVALLAAESTLDARNSRNWRVHKYTDALEEAAQIVRDSLPEVPTHIKHKPSSRPDAETSMQRSLNFALTKIRRAKEMNELTGNHIELNNKMLEAIASIRGELDALEEASQSCVGSDEALGAT